MPASDLLEKVIRENVLDGESFMTMDLIDVSFELGINAFGIKRNIYKIIKFLRIISIEYQRYYVIEPVRPRINGVESTQMPASYPSGRPQSLKYDSQTFFQTQSSPSLSNVMPHLNGGAAPPQVFQVTASH